MSIKYQMWLTYNAEKEKIQLPVLPESFKVKNGSKNDSINIAGLGEITIMQGRPALQFSFSSFFPATRFPGIQVSSITKPLTLIEKINSWKAGDKPVHFIATACGVDIFATIESFDYEEDGGALMNQCIHGIDLLRWMFGDEVDEVYGVTRQQFHDYLEAEDIGMAVVKFKNGAVATIEGTTNVYPKNLEETLYVFGENGTVKLGGTSTNNIDVWEFRDETEADQKNKGLEEATSNVYGNGHTSLYADMIDAIEHDRKPYVDAVAGRNALEMVLAIYKSQKEGRAVKLPLEEFASLDMAGEFS